MKQKIKRYNINPKKVYVNEYARKIDVGALMGYCCMVAGFSIDEEIYNKLPKKLRKCFKEIEGVQ